MRIKITASRKDEILKRKADYDAKKAKNDAIIQDQHNRYRTAQYQVFAGVEDEIRSILGDDMGELNIDIDTAFGDGLRVRIGNSFGGPRRTKNAALSWDWTATMQKDGTVRKESSSWSGLEACTLEQINDLKQTVRQLEIINNMDWPHILSVSLPDYNDYYNRDGIEDIGPRPDFNMELKEAELEDAIGQDVLVKCKDVGRNYRGYVYFKILKDSGSQYTVQEFYASRIDALNNGESFEYQGRSIETVRDLMEVSDPYTYRIKKSALIDGMVSNNAILSY